MDITVSNTSSVLLSLHNAPRPRKPTSEGSIGSPEPSTAPNIQHLSFKPILVNQKPAAPISLMARIDDQEYILLPNSSGVVAIVEDTLSPHEQHTVRVQAPFLDSHRKEAFEVEGLWLSQGGQLHRINGSLLDQDFSNEDALEAESDQVGRKHRHKLSILRPHKAQSSVQPDTSQEDTDIDRLQSRRKLIEVITDFPGSLAGHRGRDAASNVLQGVMGWETLLGDMFSADHVAISVEGMCLTQNCIDGVDQPAGLGDVFFRRSAMFIALIRSNIDL